MVSGHLGGVSLSLDCPWQLLLRHHGQAVEECLPGRASPGPIALMRAHGVLLLQPAVPVRLEVGQAHLPFLSELLREGFIAHRAVEAFTDPSGVRRMNLGVPGCDLIDGQE